MRYRQFLFDDLMLTNDPLTRFSRVIARQIRFFVRGFIGELTTRICVGVIGGRETRRARDDG